jgi:hypothetical protein
VHDPGIRGPNVLGVDKKPSDVMRHSTELGAASR